MFKTGDESSKAMVPGSSTEIKQDLFDIGHMVKLQLYTCIIHQRAKMATKDEPVDLMFLATVPISESTTVIIICGEMW